MPFTLGQHLTTEQLKNATAGGDDYIRTKNGEVKALAYNIRGARGNYYAPAAPGQHGAIAFGRGRQRSRRAHLFYNSGAIAPVFVKRATNDWEFIGDYRATSMTTDEDTIRRYCGDRDPNTQAGVFFIEPVNAQEQEPVEVSGGFGLPETRNAVENAAMQHAIRVLEAEGFAVRDVSRDNQGYDLTAIKKRHAILVEVKGTDAPQPRFFLTCNEKRAAERRDNWRLFVVWSARTNPTHKIYTKEQMLAAFILDPLAWECVMASRTNR